MNVPPIQACKTFAEDYANRINPELINNLLYKSVPALKHADWKIIKVAPGFAESVLPLNSETTNQHGTHQAALISLSADYTGGMALTTLLTGVPLSGIHKCKPEDAASLWLASMNVKYLNPSTGHLNGTCKIATETQKKIRDRYFQGKRVLVSLPIEFSSNGQKVAVAELKYFAQPTIQLLSGTEKASTLFKQKIKASARMIAGVRAAGTESKAENRIRIDCPHAKAAAGPHGALLAKRLRTALPQLTDMVVARTTHIDETLNAMESVEQVVLLGAGLDMRPFRFAHTSPAISFFEVDLPEMLEERERVISEMDLPNVTRYSIAADFLKDKISRRILESSPFDPARPTLFVYEGCSMYFNEQENQNLLADVWNLAQNPQSRIWCDLVARSVVNGETSRPEITDFLNQMDNLGETFIFGSDDPVGFVKSIGCTDGNSESCREFLQASENIYDVYQFCVGNGRG